MNFHMSQELSKKLHDNGCELEAKTSYYKNAWIVSDTVVESDDWEEWEFKSLKLVPRYHILEDICCRYAKEFFWEKAFDSIEGIEQDSWCDWFWTPYNCERIIIFPSITQRILLLVQQWKKQEAEEYFWKNTIYNPKNKLWKKSN